MNLPDLHFLRPLWLALIPFGMILTLLVWHFLGKKSDWSKVISPALLSVLSSGNRSTRNWMGCALLCLVWGIAALAAAGPAWEKRPQPLFDQSQSRIILFDLSLSMKTADVLPDRLQLAKFKLIDLIGNATNKQQALIVFAGDGFIVAPFTNDADTLVNLVPGLDTATVPVQGSRIDKALQQARQLIDNAAARRVEIVLITDGGDRRSLALASDLAAAGHRLQILGVGTRQGAPVPLENGGLLKDDAGNIVIPGLDADFLATLAQAGGGSYANIGLDNRQIDRLNLAQPTVDDLFAETQSTAFSGDSWNDAGALLLLPLLLLASLGFRRGWLLALAVVIVPIPQPVYAFEWKDLWQTQEQQAAESLATDKPIPANASAGWHAASAFKKDQFKQASDGYRTITDSDKVTASDHYNLGNALAKSGSLQEALDNYEAALAITPTMQDAIYNRNIVRQLLEQQEKNKGQTDSAQSDQSNDEQQPGEESANEDNQGQGQQDARDSEMQDAQSQQQNQQAAQSDKQQNPQENEELEEGEGEESETTREQEQQQVAELPQTENEPGYALNEQQQALEQWLKKIPDDPGGLLKRKFLYQYRQRPQNAPGVQRW